MKDKHVPRFITSLNLYNTNNEKLHQLTPCILGLNFRGAEDLRLCLKDTKTADHACESKFKVRSHARPGISMTALNQNSQTNMA